MLTALDRWVRDEAARHPELVRLGCFGSYVRGDWGPGSDLDLVAVVRASREPFERRCLSWSTEVLPVPVDLLVYTEAEWKAVGRRGGRFARVLREEVLWVWPPLSRNP
ncbi:nucleotidyltransferase domain-containing protein [Deferrisoma camini]|uniref:nucleotidyltransferase domain-containing protein n=1 Tax=Deferrisoma camini TaxID=1035120 RepID=UPI00046CABA3|nr:nucleotidyltransferase domain-containing protein [Deferrisoma camini]